MKRKTKCKKGKKERNIDDDEGTIKAGRNMQNTFFGEF
jgi:hypothetical protein